MERGSALGSKQQMLIAGGCEMGRWMIGPGRKEGMMTAATSMALVLQYCREESSARCDPCSTLQWSRRPTTCSNIFPISALRHRRVFWGARHSTSSGCTQHVDTQPPANAAGYTQGTPAKTRMLLMRNTYMYVCIMYIGGDRCLMCCHRFHTCLVHSSNENINRCLITRGLKTAPAGREGHVISEVNAANYMYLEEIIPLNFHVINARDCCGFLTFHMQIHS